MVATMLWRSAYFQIMCASNLAHAFVASSKNARLSFRRSAPIDLEKQSRDEFDSVVMKTYGRYPITMVKGEGSTLTDSTGKTYVDFVAGIATCCLGHGHKELADAVTAQISTLHHVSNLYYIPQQGKLASWLVKNSPADRVFFCNSGAEANEAAIKLSRKHAYTKLDIEEPVIITAESSFHGRTLATVTATGQPKCKAFCFLFDYLLVIVHKKILYRSKIFRPARAWLRVRSIQRSRGTAGCRQADQWEARLPVEVAVLEEAQAEARGDHARGAAGGRRR